MKVLVVPDTHGQDNWIEEIKNYTYDKVVFLGDYFDNFDGNYKGKVAVANFEKIVKFVREDPQNRYLLIGNHDISYLCNSICSGYQPSMRAAYSEALIKAKDLLKVVADIDGVWFSHAGVSKTWFTEFTDFYKERVDFDQQLTDAEKINFTFSDFLKSVERQHMLFTFQSWFEFYRWDTSGCGEHVKQTPLWIRPNALLEDGLANNKQVVGHTEYCDDKLLKLTNDASDILILADSNTHKVLGCVDTEKLNDDESYQCVDDLQDWLQDLRNKRYEESRENLLKDLLLAIEENGV